jgi:hypothetical protein
MPVNTPTIDGRRYDDLLAEAVARIRVHNPEWTNFNRSDPGITLLELFAFLTENVLYRANLIPDRNRRKFLSLLGVPLQPAQSARGLVTFANERGPMATVTLNADVEVRAGEIPFRTTMGVDVLPVEARVYYKRRVPLSDDVKDIYRKLYATLLMGPETADDLDPYETVLLDGTDPDGVDLVTATADGALWVALVARAGVTDLDEVRAVIAGRILSLGIVPVVADPGRTLPPAGTAPGESEGHLEYATPSVPSDGRLPDEPRLRIPRYQSRDARPNTNVVLRPGIVQVSLPDRQGLRLWTNMEPTEAGVDQFPPALDDTRIAERVVTWIRVRAPGTAQARLLWVGANAAPAVQRARVASEVLPNGNGQPDQSVTLATAPVIPGSVRLTVTGPPVGSPVSPPQAEDWTEIADLLDAGPEVPVPDPRLPPGARRRAVGPTDVFVLDAEAGTLRFGDGLRGRRPPPSAQLRATYDFGLGRAGNVGPRSINTGPALPAGFTVSNPVRTWGGADAESVAEGEKQVARYLQHRDRMVKAEDFDTIARRTPGVEIGRVDVIAAYQPASGADLPGGAPGAVTLLLVPAQDPVQPDAPAPDRFFLDTVCRHLDPRRLVTTELHLRGPDYVPIWISVGIDAVSGASLAEVQKQVRTELLAVLSPLPRAIQREPATATYQHAESGWPLRTAVTRAELLTFAARVAGVRVVNSILLAAESSADQDRVEMTGLQLPRVAGISVVPGDAAPLDRLRGTAPEPGPAVPRIPVPVIPEVC